jgi:hypothetical protein
MPRACFSIPLSLLALSSLVGCDEPPPTAQTIADQHRFEVGCRAQDAQGYEMNMPYCGRREGGHERMKP